MPREVVALEGAENIIMCPLNFITNFTEFVVCFAITEYDDDTLEFRRLCCLRPNPENFLPRPKHPVIFEVIGEIAEDDCYLTARGDERQGPDGDPIASCWIKARPDDISQIYWRSLPSTIQAITDVIPGVVDTTKLIVGRDGVAQSVRLQVLWRAPEGKSLAQSLPVFSTDGTPCVPSSLADVPFNRALRFVFTLEYYHQVDNVQTRMMYANLIHAVYV